MGIADTIRNNIKNGASREYSEAGLYAIADELDRLNSKAQAAQSAVYEAVEKGLSIAEGLNTQLTAKDEALEKVKKTLIFIRGDAYRGLLEDRDEEDFGETLARIEARAKQTLAEIKEASDE